MNKLFMITALCSALIQTATAAEVSVPAATLRNQPIAPAGIDDIDGAIGNVSLDAFRKEPERLTFHFDDPAFPAKPSKVAFGNNAVHFEGFTRDSRKGYFISGTHALIGVGKEKQTSATIEFDRPVKAVGFVLQFATGTIKVRFFDVNGDQLFEAEQNGQGDPSGNGTWADYFTAYANSEEYGRIKRIEFQRSNLNEGAVPEFSIDDFSIVTGTEPLNIVPPEPRNVDLSLIGATDAATIAPMRPSGQPQLTEGNGTVTFANQVDGTSYRYEFSPAAGLPSLRIAANGQAAVPAGKEWQFQLAGKPVSWELVSQRRNGDHLQCDYRWNNGSATLPVTLDLSLSGGSLVMKFSSRQGAAVNIAPPKIDRVLKLSDSANTTMRGMDPVVFLGFSGDLFYLADQRQFYSYYVDWTKSNATSPYSSINYEAVGKKYAPLAETIAITISDALPKVLPTIPNQTSPYREKIASSIVMEFWYGNFSELAELLDTYGKYGMNDLIVLMHRWQNAGFDRKYPSVLPPSPSRGGLDTLREAAAIARSNGQTLALHENYKDFYPDSAVWNPDDLLLNSSGKPQNAWADSKEMAPSKIRKYAEPTMKRIKEEIGTNGCFLDVHSTHLPWWRVDFRPGVPGAGMMRGTLEPTNALWAMARNIYQGPVFGESYALTSWIHTGNIDSVMGQSSYNAGLILDFQLTKIRPLATNHGAGYFERWNPRGYVADWPSCPLPPQEYARYSLQEVAYQTAPTIDDKIKHEILPAATAYYQKRQLVKRLANQPVTRIDYVTADNRTLTSSEAVLLPKTEIQRLFEHYADGSAITLNFSDQEWQGLAPLSFRAVGPGFEAETNRLDGIWFDYYGDAENYYLNSRNFDWQMEPKGTAAMGRPGEGTEPILANHGNESITRGPLTTDTAVALNREADGNWRLRFFPHRWMGMVTVDLEQLGFSPSKVEALDGEGNTLSSPGDEITQHPGKLTIRHRDGKVWSYRLHR